MAKNTITAQSFNAIFNSIGKTLKNLFRGGDTITRRMAFLQSNVDSSLANAETIVDTIEKRLDTVTQVSPTGLRSSLIVTSEPGKYIDLKAIDLYDGKVAASVGAGSISGIHIPAVFSRSRVKGPWNNLLAQAVVARRSGYHVRGTSLPNYCLDTRSDTFWYEIATGTVPITTVPSWAYHEDRLTSLWTDTSVLFEPTIGPCIQLNIERDTNTLFNQIVIKPFSIYPMRILDIRAVDAHNNRSSLLINLDEPYLELTGDTVIAVGDYASVPEVYARTVEIVLNQPHYVAEIADSTIMQQRAVELFTLLSSSNERFTNPMLYEDLRLDTERYGMIQELTDRLMQLGLRDGIKDADELADRARDLLEEFLNQGQADNRMKYEYLYGLNEIDLRYAVHRSSARFVSKPISLRKTPTSIAIDLVESSNDYHTITGYLALDHSHDEDILVPIEFGQELYIYKNADNNEMADQLTQNMEAFFGEDTNAYFVNLSPIEEVQYNTSKIDLKHAPYLDYWEINVALGANVNEGIAGSFNPNTGLTPDTAVRIAHPLNVEVVFNNGLIAPQDVHKEEYWRPDGSILRGEVSAIKEDGAVEQFLRDHSPADRTSYSSWAAWHPVYLHPDAALDGLPTVWRDVGHTDWDPEKPIVLLFDIDAVEDIAAASKVYFDPINNNSDPEQNPDGDPCGATRYKVNPAEGTVVLDPNFVRTYGIGNAASGDSGNKVYALYWEKQGRIPYELNNPLRANQYCRNVTNYFSDIQPVLRKYNSDPKSAGYYPVIEYLHLGNRIFFAQQLDAKVRVRYSTLLPRFRVIVDMKSEGYGGSTPVINGVSLCIRGIE